MSNPTDDARRNASVQLLQGLIIRSGYSSDAKQCDSLVYQSIELADRLMAELSEREAVADTMRRDICNALMRAAVRLDADVAAIIAANPLDYQAEFPGTDAELIRQAIDLLKPQA